MVSQAKPREIPPAALTSSSISLRSAQNDTGREGLTAREGRLAKRIKKPSHPLRKMGRKDFRVATQIADFPCLESTAQTYGKGYSPRLSPNRSGSGRMSIASRLAPTAVSLWMGKQIPFPSSHITSYYNAKREEMQEFFEKNCAATSRTERRLLFFAQNLHFIKKYQRNLNNRRFLEKVMV